ncbi:MAG TPA: DUF1343 domain-containing protein [Gemmatimonadales bacterium]|nr:DUF1343 domain-containing protein [Gemmatimonadales bacterium]
MAGTPAAGTSLAGMPRAGASAARPGIDVLLADSAQLVRGRRVGLVTNQTGVDAQGATDVARLLAAGVQVVALFSPEHGFRGTAAPGEAVASSIDSATGLPIYSLYGRTSAPSDSMLAGVDVMLVDLQDVGARYFTYLNTTVDVMRAAGRRGVPVVVLDRPNPIGGAVQGNVLDPRYASSIGRLAVPMRHGLTLGELARLARADLQLDVQLTIVPASGWTRAMAFDATGLPFVPPSPNLKSLDALFHYPGTCLFEGTALSVGRGSDAPFEQIGAPWLDTTAVLARLRRAAVPGVRFESTAFTPRRPGDGRFADTLVAGIRLVLTDRASYDPTATAVRLLAAILAVHGDRIGWIPAHFDRLAGGPTLRDALRAGVPPDSIVAGWAPARAAFERRSAAVRIYR